ncbi:hypothetical protein ACWD6R_08940 [Streptomyces sp. NPDC005151]
MPMCSPGRTKLTWTSKAKPWVVTHRKVLENSTGGTAKKTFGAEKVREITAAVTATVGSKVSGKIVLASLEASVGLELKAEGEATRKTSESITHQVSKNGT